MAQKRAEEVVQFLFDCLEEKKLNISKIIIFGSQAKGTETEESDIDIIIVSEDFKRKNIFKRADMTKDAEIRTIRKFMVPLDIITITPEEYENKTSLIAEYVHTGKIVYVN
ncbi:MAG: nucleotidyltransferase domain-containing protein [Proteobacteria bacterium]|nr:nucleotidyltransferase domain-containing protein [Pseudomonadota bacterium]